MRHDSDHKNVGDGVYALLAFGILLLTGGIALPLLNLETKVGLGAVLVMVLFGLAMSLFATGLIVVAKLYVRTRASEAFVKTGKGGMVVVQDGGAIVIPMIHEITRVSLQTLVLSVKREGGADALITKDKLRANIEAQFYLCVKPKDPDIQSAARSLGNKTGDEISVRNLIENKLVSALRNAASVRTLEELNSDREAFTKAVEGYVKDDLAHNGLTLESVTISHLDQTDPKTLKEDNIFDAQGLRTIAEITQKARTARNLLEKIGAQEREQQDVETQKKIFALQQQRAEAEAKQKAEIASINAAQDRAAKEKEIERDRALAIAVQQKDQAVQVATQEKERAVSVAVQQKDQAVQVATQEKLAAIAEAEQAKALKEAAKNGAEAQREKEAQGIVTVKAQAEAERQKRVDVTQAEAEAQKLKVAAEQAADAAAYRTQKEAEAQKAAAEAQAEATRRNAEAAAAARVAKAEADAKSALVIAEAEANGKTAIVAATRAEAMIPVDVQVREVEVQKAQVDVQARQVEVLQQELEARAAHGQAAQDFELAKLRVTKEAEVRIASAQAFAELHGKMEVTVVSTAEDAVRMNQRYLQGLGLANALGGFVGGADDKVLEGAGEIAGLMRNLLERLQKSGMTPEK